jgi:16S rRNA (guanine527-N7)-methyltransferase
MTSYQLLASGAKEIGIPLSDEHIKTFLIFFAELEKWNKKINLTTIREERDIVIKHGLDSLSFLQGFVASPGCRLLDMGAGAGFPALPIKIVHPEIAVTLVESVKKKASFLRHIIRILKLSSAEVLDQRINQLAASFHAAFDVVTARAFADMKTALVSGLPFLKSGGFLVLSRGPQETINGHEITKVGAVLEKQIRLTLPHSNFKRTIWVFKKSNDVPRGTFIADPGISLNT